VSEFRIVVVEEDDLNDLLRLMQAYCDFYDVAPPDSDLLGLSRALIADHEAEGVQLLARATDGAPVGFASVFWSWSTTAGARIGTMNDLFVTPAARRSGLADELIAACVERCRLRTGVARLEWQTATDNRVAQRVYERAGARQSEWIDYSLDIGPGSR